MDASWTGKIAFGLVIIPVALYSAVDTEPISFNWLHKKCGNRVSTQKYCPVCNEELKQEDIIRGYNYIGDKYVTLTDDEIDSAKTTRNKSIVLESFVSKEEVDPLYYNKSYYVVPTGGEKPFILLKEAIKRERKIGIAKTVIGAKESTLALWVRGDDMVASTLFFANEIRKPPYVPSFDDVTLTDVNTAGNLIKTMTAEFRPEEYHNTDRERLQNIIQKKIEEAGIEKPATSALQGNDNLADALNKSVRIAMKQNKNRANSEEPAPEIATKLKKTKGK